MAAVKILSDVYWVGAVDWNVRNFHGHVYATPRGSTYNCYLILDDKITLVDTVYGPFAGEMLENIRQITAPEKIDYVVVNHVETDHSGALPRLLAEAPRARLYGTARCREGLRRHYYGDWDFREVKTGDRLALGKRSLTFLEAPMLHWPDSMFSYCPEEELLLPNDAFGQHYASSRRFDDEVDEAELMEEAARYYANILWPLSPLVLKKLEEVGRLKLAVKMIAPSHGIIWRRPERIVRAYQGWAKNETRPKAVIVYETMWGATGRMARQLAEGVAGAGVEVKIYDVNQTASTEIFTRMLDAGGFLVGSSTHNRDLLPHIAGFLEQLKGLRPANRIGAVFGSYGWAGGAAASLERYLQETGVEIVSPPLTVKYVPDESEDRAAYEYGKAFGEKLKGRNR